MRCDLDTVHAEPVVEEFDLRLDVVTEITR